MFIISKIQIESYSQRSIVVIRFYLYCVHYFKDTNWKLFTTNDGGPVCLSILCSLFQRYKLKAIHNTNRPNDLSQLTVFIISKIQIESYSQLVNNTIRRSIYCVHYFKDTNWKLFTTSLYNLVFNDLLCSLFQRYKLKAIHNKRRLSE